jgi:hypothetical protein
VDSHEQSNGIWSLVYNVDSFTDSFSDQVQDNQQMLKCVVSVSIVLIKLTLHVSPSKCCLQRLNVPLKFE